MRIELSGDTLALRRSGSTGMASLIGTFRIVWLAAWREEAVYSIEVHCLRSWMQRVIEMAAGSAWQGIWRIIYDWRHNWLLFVLAI